MNWCVINWCLGIVHRSEYIQLEINHALDEFPAGGLTALLLSMCRSIQCHYRRPNCMCFYGVLFFMCLGLHLNTFLEQKLYLLKWTIHSISDGFFNEKLDSKHTVSLLCGNSTC